MTSSNQSMTGKRGILKAILIIEIIVCYMAVLTVISHIRGPEPWVLSDAPLLRTEDFMPLNSVKPETEEVFHFQNDGKGDAVGFSAPLGLQGVERIQISFQVECSNEYAGGLLCVDLCAEGYDNPEQEKQIELQAGSNDVSFELSPGDGSPDYAQLRFFTVSPADFKITELRIYQVVPAPKVSLGMALFAAVCIIALVVTICIFINSYYRSRKQERSGLGIAKKMAHILFPSVLFIMIAVPTIASFLHIQNENALIGVTLSPYPQDVSLRSVVDGEFQDNWEKWFRDNFYGHTEIVKCHNQIEYSVFHDGIGDWIQGKDGYLFSKGDAYKYVAGANFDYGQDQDFDAFAEQVYKFQSQLNKMGKSFLYLITPVKVEIYPEKLPWYEQIAAGYSAKGNDIDSADRLVAAFEKYGVTYYDMRDDILTLKQESNYEVFPVEGDHWTLNAVAEEANRMNPKLHELIPDITFPTLNITGVLNQKFETDSDILELQNVFWGKHSDSYCFPLVDYVEKSDANVYVFGTSMSNQINNVLYSDSSHSAFEKIVYSKYFTTIEVRGKTGKTFEVYTEDDEPSDLNILDHIKESDLIVMESVDYMGVNDKLKEIHTKFLDYVNGNLGSLLYSLTDDIILLDDNSAYVVFEGFHNLEDWGRWTDGNRSLIHIFGSELSDASTDMNMRLSVNSFATNQKVDVLINGVYSTTLNVTTVPGDYTVSIPRNMIQPQENVIEFRLQGEVFSPKELGQSEDNRQLGIAVSSLVMEEGG